jgi:hypothetical protein
LPGGGPLPRQAEPRTAVAAAARCSKWCHRPTVNTIRGATRMGADQASEQGSHAAASSAPN